MRVLSSKLYFAGLSALAAAVLTPHARATTVIDWSDASVTFTVIDAQNVQVTGLTTGDFALPFTVQISTVNATVIVTRNATGGQTSPLNMNMPVPRNALTLLTLTASLDGGFAMEDIAYTFLDVDGSPSQSNFRNWRDQVTVTNAGATLTAVNSNFVQVTGLTATATGRNGNIDSTSTDGNVLVSIPGPTSTLGFVYGPGPGDLFNANQLIAISNITFLPQIEVTVPEPGAFALVAGGVVCLIVLSRRARGGVSAERASRAARR